MVKAYNIAATHRLTPIAGFDEITHLQKVAPMDAAAASMPNEAGEEPGMHSGSVMSLNEAGALVAGATETAMPLFLLWNSYDSDAQPLSATTANGKNLAGIQGIGGNGTTLDSAALMRYLYSGAEGSPVTNANGNNNGTATGGASALSVSDQGAYSLKAPVGSYTTWPATCGLELSSTEFDYEMAFSGDTYTLDTTSANKFKINALLTSPAKLTPAAGQTIADLPSSSDITNTRARYQRRRGGYLTVFDPVTAEDAIKADMDAGTTKTGYYNICGTVSRPIELNENGVYVLYFWAERTLIPYSITKGST